MRGLREPIAISELELTKYVLTPSPTKKKWTKRMKIGNSSKRKNLANISRSWKSLKNSKNCSDSRPKKDR